MAVRYQNVFGSEKQLDEIKDIIKNFKIKVMVLDKTIIINKFLLSEEWKLMGNINELENYFIAFQNHNNTILRFTKKREGYNGR